MFAGTGSGNFIHILDLHLKRLREIPVHPLQHRFTGAFLIEFSLDDHGPEMARFLLLELDFPEPRHLWNMNRKEEARQADRSSVFKKGDVLLAALQRDNQRQSPAALANLVRSAYGITRSISDQRHCIVGQRRCDNFAATRTVFVQCLNYRVLAKFVVSVEAFALPKPSRLFRIPVMIEDRNLEGFADLLSLKRIKRFR